MVDVFTVIFAGLIVWLVTTIVVEGVVFTDLRRSLDHYGLSHGWGHYIELWHCHLCAGVWVGWGVALLMPGPVTVALGPGNVLGILLNGFLYKAVAHIVLEATAMMKNHNVMSAGDESRRLVYEAERIAEHRHSAWKEFNNAIRDNVPAD